VAPALESRERAVASIWADSAPWPLRGLRAAEEAQPVGDDQQRRLFVEQQAGGEREVIGSSRREERDVAAQ
jgi:hypothetical protein